MWLQFISGLYVLKIRYSNNRMNHYNTDNISMNPTKTDNVTMNHKN